MTNNYAPFPELERQQQDQSIRQQYEALLEREARDAQAALDAKLARINETGDISELKKDMKLRFAFEDRFGWQRFGELNGKAIKAQSEAEKAAKIEKWGGRRTLSTEQGRIDALNKARKATQNN